MIDQDTIQELRDLNASNGMDAMIGPDTTWGALCNILADGDPESRARRMRRAGIASHPEIPGADDMCILNDMADAIVERMRHMMELSRMLREKAAHIACDSGLIPARLVAEIRNDQDMARVEGPAMA